MAFLYGKDALAALLTGCFAWDQLIYAAFAG